MNIIWLSKIKIVSLCYNGLGQNKHYSTMVAWLLPLYLPLQNSDHLIRSFFKLIE